MLVDDELLARVGLVGVHRDGALAGLRQAGDADDVAFALVVHIVAGLHGAQRLQRIGAAGLVPDIPQRAVFLAQPPQRKGLQAQLARGAHLVQHGDAIEEPDHVALVVVLVDVFEVRIERVVIEIEIGVGIGGALPGFGDRTDLRCRAPSAWRMPCGLSDRESRASSRSRSCRRRRSASPWARSLSTRRRLPTNQSWLAIGPGIAVGLVLVVVHQHNAVGVGGDRASGRRRWWRPPR